MKKEIKVKGSLTGIEKMEIANYKLTLSERLKDGEEWIKDYLIFKRHSDITNKATKEIQSKVPLVPTLLKIYFLPTIILNLFLDFEDWYKYNKFTREVKIIKNELYIESCQKNVEKTLVDLKKIKDVSNKNENK